MKSIKKHQKTNNMLSIIIFSGKSYQWWQRRKGKERKTQPFKWWNILRLMEFILRLVEFLR